MNFKINFISIITIFLIIQINAQNYFGEEIITEKDYYELCEIEDNELFLEKLVEFKRKFFQTFEDECNEGTYLVYYYDENKKKIFLWLH